MMNKKQTAAAHEKGDCMRSRGLRKSRRSARRSPRTQRNKRHKTRHKYAVQEGTRRESQRMTQRIYNARRSTINYHFVAEVWSNIIVKKLKYQSITKKTHMHDDGASEQRNSNLGSFRFPSSGNLGNF